MKINKTESRIFKFSHRRIASLDTPPLDWPSSNIEWTDAVESGLRAAVYKSGKRSYRYRYTYRGRKKLITIGPCNAMSVEKAREIVRRHKAILAEGRDPREVREDFANAPTFGEFAVNDFIPIAAKKRKAMKDVKSRLRRHLLPTFGSKRLSDITKREIIRWHAQLHEDISATTANRSLSLLSSALREALELELISVNPARGIRKAKEKGPRTRVLSSDEFRRLVVALMKILKTRSGAAVFLLLSLGLRKLEVLSLAWGDVDFDRECMYIRENKTDIPRYVPINSQAKEVLQWLWENRDPKSEWVFPSNSASGHLMEVRRTFKSLLKDAGIESFRTHDLRRQFATNLLNNGVSLYEVKELLGHQDLRSTQIYAKLASNTLRTATETSAVILQQEMSRVP